MSRVVSVLAISLVLGACASRQPERPKEKPLAQPEAPAATTTAVAPTACSVYVYRNKTMFHSANPELPFLYVGDVKVGRLAIGESRCLRLAPGKHTISVKEPFMFMPSYTSGAVDVHVIAGGAPFYVRYGREFGGVFSTGSNTTVTGSSKLQPATEEQWRGRQ